jgi:hypothetical protein
MYILAGTLKGTSTVTVLAPAADPRIPVAVQTTRYVPLPLSTVICCVYVLALVSATNSPGPRALKMATTMLFPVVCAPAKVRVLVFAPPLLCTTAEGIQAPDRQFPEPLQLVPPATSVHAVVLVPGWQLWQEFIGLAAPDAA